MRDVNLLTSNGVNVQQSLELFGDMEMYDDTMGDFLDSVPGKLEKIDNYKKAGSMPDYAIEVHSLKSDAKYLGFTKLAELAYAHELKSKENDKSFVHNNYDELIAEANRIIDLAKKYMSGEDVKTTVDNSNSNNNQITVDNSNTPSILVVDDSDIIRNFIERIFSKDYNIVLANNGEEAINIVNNNSNNIVCMLLDLNMPKIDGFEVLDYFKSHDLFNKIPVSIITGDDSKDRIDRAFTYPIVDMIVKPFNENNVKTVVEKTMMR